MRTLHRGMIGLTVLFGLGLAATAAEANGVPHAEVAYYELPPIWRGPYGGVHLGYAEAHHDDGVVGGVQLGWELAFSEAHIVRDTFMLFGMSEEDAQMAEAITKMVVEMLIMIIAAIAMSVLIPGGGTVAAGELRASRAAQAAQCAAGAWHGPFGPRPSAPSGRGRPWPPGSAWR